jgi:hypothetical protein
MSEFKKNIEVKLKITKSDSLSGQFFLTNNHQITMFDSAMLTVDGSIWISHKGGIPQVLQEEIVEEATQLMIDNGIVITNEKVGV